MMFIIPRQSGFYLPPKNANVDWSHPASIGLKALWVFGVSKNINTTTLAGELSGLVDPTIVTSQAGNGMISDAAAYYGDYASVSQSGAQASNFFRVTTSVPISGDFSFVCFVMRSIDTGGSSNETQFVQEVATTIKSGGGAVGLEFNLGNLFGAAGDKNKPRLGGTAGSGAANAWVNGAKQSSTNPFDISLVNGTWYGISGTIPTVPLGNGNLTFFSNASGGAYGMTGGLAIFAIFNKIFPDAIMADLSLNPFSLLNFTDEIEMSILTGAVQPPATIIYAFDQVGAHINRKITSLGY